MKIDCVTLFKFYLEVETSVPIPRQIWLTHNLRKLFGNSKTKQWTSDKCMLIYIHDYLKPVASRNTRTGSCFWFEYSVNLVLPVHMCSYHTINGRHSMVNHHWWSYFKQKSPQLMRLIGTLIILKIYGEQNSIWSK